MLPWMFPRQTLASFNAASNAGCFAATLGATSFVTGGMTVGSRLPSNSGRVADGTRSVATFEFVFTTRYTGSLRSSRFWASVVVDHNSDAMIKNWPIQRVCLMCRNMLPRYSFRLNQQVPVMLPQLLVDGSASLR